MNNCCKKSRTRNEKNSYYKNQEQANENQQLLQRHQELEDEKQQL